MPRIAPIPTIEQETSASGPLTQPNAQGGRLGDFASGVDRQLADVGERTAYFAQARENDQALAWAQSSASQFKLGQFDKMKDAQNNAQGPADGFTQQYLEGYDKDAQQLLDTAPNARARKYLANHLEQFRTSTGEQAKGFEVQQGRAYRVNSFDDATKNSAQLVFNDPSQYEAEVKNLTDNANALQLHPDERYKIADQAKRQLTDSYWAGQAQRDPQGTVNQLKAYIPLSQTLPDGTVTPGQDVGVPGKIVAQAKSQGVDPHVALAVASLETGGTFSPTAKNPRSSATGVFQVIDSTWGGLGGTAENRGDPDAQVELGVKNLAQNAKALKQTLGREPTPGEQYMAQLFGIGGASAILKSPETTPVRDVVAKYDKGNADATVNNNGMAGMNVGQARAHWDGIIAQHMQKTAGDANAPEATSPSDPAASPAASESPAVANLSLADRMKYLNYAQSLQHKDDSAEKAILQGRIQDTKAANDRGEQAPNPPTFAELTKHYPVAVASKMQSDLIASQQFGFDVSAVKTLPFDRQQDLLKSREPQPGDGFAKASERHDSLVRAANYVNQQRLIDPIAYAQGMGGKITAPLDTSNPDFLSGQMAGRFVQAAQVASDYGTPYKPFSAPEAQQLGTLIDHAPPAVAAQYLGQLSVAAGGNADYYNAALAQLAPQHPTIAVAGALQAKQVAGQPDIAAAILTGERMLNPQKGDKAEGQKRADLLLPKDDGAAGFKQAWQTATQGAYGPLYQSEQQDFAAAKAAYVGMQSAGERSEVLDANLWQKVVDHIAPSTTHAGAQTLVPIGSDPTTFNDTISTLWPNVTKSAGIGAEDYPVGSVQLQAFDDGKYLAYQGTSPIYRSDGKPLAFDMSGNILTGPDVAPIYAPSTPVTKASIRASAPQRFRSH